MSRNNPAKRETVAAVVLTYNNEKIIERLLKSIEGIDEIIIVDSGSMDGTEAVIRQVCPKAKIFYRKLDSFAEQRNFGLDRAASDWIIHIDSDEEFTKEICDSIKEVLESGTDKNGFRYVRREHFHGVMMEYRPHVSDELRMHRRFKARWVGSIDERLELRGEVGKLQGYVKHYNIPNFTHWLKKINHYTDEKAKRYGPDEKYGLLFILKTILNPIRTFYRGYVLRKGYRDGYLGLATCAIRVFAVFLSYLKMWENEKYGISEEMDYYD